MYIERNKYQQTCSKLTTLGYFKDQILLRKKKPNSIENLVIKIIVEKFPNLKKEVDIQIQEEFRRKQCYFDIQMGRKSVKS